MYRLHPDISKNSKMVSKGITRLHRPYRSVKISSSAGSRHSRNAIPPSRIHSGSLSSMIKYTAKYTTQPMQIPATTVLRFFSFCSFSKRICSSPILPRQSTLIPCSVCADLVIKEYAWSYPENALHGPFPERFANPVHKRCGRYIHRQEAASVFPPPKHSPQTKLSDDTALPVPP